MKKYAVLLLAPAALLFQALPAVLIYLSPRMFYGANARLPEDWAWFFSMTWLIFCAVTGLFLGCAASYGVLTRIRGILAAPVILLFCVPVWMLSVFYLQAVLVFFAYL